MVLILEAGTQRGNRNWTRGHSIAKYLDNYYRMGGLKKPAKTALSAQIPDALSGRRLLRAPPYLHPAESTPENFLSD